MEKPSKMVRCTCKKLFTCIGKKWDCQSDYGYHCMVDREKERETLGMSPVKYHGKWPFKRLYEIQIADGKKLLNIDPFPRQLQVRRLNHGSQQTQTSDKKMPLITQIK